jgi:hypothetical protein
MPQTSRSLLAGSLALSFVLAAAPSWADTKSCIASHASAQREAKSGRLKQASQLYTACGSDPACPEQLRAECAELLEKLKSSVPSVIFSAIDGKGADQANVKVYADDALVADGLDGRAVELDPGKYHFRFVLPDNSVLTTDVLVREGDKNRVVEVRAAEEKRAAPAAVPTSPGPAPVQDPPKPEEQRTPTGAWVMSGVAVVGLATFGTFAVLGNSDKKKLDECSPSCPESEHDRRDSLKTKFLIADIGLGVGAASAIVAGILFVTSSGPAEAERRARAFDRKFGVTQTPGGAQFMLRGQF